MKAPIFVTAHNLYLAVVSRTSFDYVLAGVTGMHLVLQTHEVFNSLIQCLFYTLELRFFVITVFFLVFLKCSTVDYFWLGLVELMSSWCQTEDKPPHPQVLRFMAHLVLFLRAIAVNIKVNEPRIILNSVTCM